MTLAEARASEGAAVAYDPESDWPEVGWITGSTGSMVLVRYGVDETAKATRPEDIAFLFTDDAMKAARAVEVTGGG